MSQTPFPVDAKLSAIAIAWRNNMLIADNVLPRVPVALRFSYTEMPVGQGFTVPDTHVGRKSKPNEVEFSGRLIEARCDTYGLDDPIPQDDIDEAKNTRFDPVGSAAEYLARLIALDREKRVAELVFNPDIYDTNKRQLAGGDQWSAAGSKPVDDINRALDAMIMRGNTLVIGRDAWTKLSSHPDIVAAAYRISNAGAKGMVTQEAVAALFGLQSVQVGEAWLNTARKGQTVAMQRVWGKHCALHYQEPVSNTRTATIFGFTGEYDSRQAGAMEDKNIGAKGGQRVRVWEQVKEVIAAPALGYFLQTVVA